MKRKFNFLKEWNIRCTQVGRGVKSEKLSHKNAIKHRKGDPLRFCDNRKYPPQKNLSQTPRTHLGFPTTVHLWNETFLQASVRSSANTATKDFLNRRDAISINRPASTKSSATSHNRRLTNHFSLVWKLLWNYFWGTVRLSANDQTFFST